MMLLQQRRKEWKGKELKMTLKKAPVILLIHLRKSDQAEKKSLSSAFLHVGSLLLKTAAEKCTFHE